MLYYINNNLRKNCEKGSLKRGGIKMKDLSIGDLLDKYKIDVEQFNIKDGSNIESIKSMLYKRKKIVEIFEERIDKLSEEEKNQFFEFLKVDDKFLEQHIPDIRAFYPELYELEIEPVDYKILKLLEKRIKRLEALIEKNEAAIRNNERKIEKNEAAIKIKKDIRINRIAYINWIKSLNEQM